ncbi:NAD(P)-dependent oxidoreductase [Allonocardiopsis opalescens]|uniref:3-hydroxyisobutyrate dehydrogenase-like beta-hydroxyacid dehydrogenase n=1 Tax=Allonocardiopsis opalescens TaxID=1144618 RepID=A0A2T0PY03_9ACTN|nr:NAD(P)-dependent oxidoreductase [Allonocardiopsis opalescens]PRX96338.1 3-hydroxyisobutyrate dehydrogenase-like beta-hydroxyacid dehydrogenase [Allonocardiopsis opalescens]
MDTGTDGSGAVAVVGGDNARGAAVGRVLAEAGGAVALPVAAGAVELPPGARLVVVCAEDHGALLGLLDRAGRRLAGRDVVDLTSGTGDEAREAAERVADHGGRYLRGALMGHPEHVGEPETVLVYSGAAEVFRDRETVLARLGGATYLGADPGTASLYDLAMLNLAWATLTGYLHTAALLGTDGVGARTLTPLLTHWLRTTVADVIEGYAGQIDDRAYPGDQEWLELDAPLMEHLVRTSEQRGVDSALPRLVQSLTARGIAAGRGRESFAGLVEVIRR